MTDHTSVIVHSFETCTDPDCDEVLCGYYRAGLAAGHGFMKGTGRGLARDRVPSGETSGGKPTLA